MSLLIKSSIIEQLEKTNNAKGIYQFEVVKSLLNGEKAKEDIISILLKHPQCQVNASRLRCHRVWQVLAKKGLIQIQGDLVKLQGFEDLEESEKNEIRNTANKARRNVSDFREGGYTMEVSK